MENKVETETENIFNENFWESQNYIINAVDNLDARIYISNQCLIYKKILIDSGTLGTRANSQVIIPNKTVKYIEENKEDSEQERIAMCTLRNYPTLITHCIEWARDKFEGYFVKIIRDLKLFCENKEKYYEKLNKEKSGDFNIQAKELETIIKYSKLILNRNFDDCLEIAFNEFNNRFNNDIIQLLIDNPIDSLNEDGSKFWSSNKRVPINIPFNDKNELIILYIKKYSQILAKSLSITINDDNEYIINKCKSFKLEKFTPTKKSLKKQKNRYLLTNEQKKLAKKERIEKIELRLKLQKDNYENIKKIANNIDFSKFENILDFFNISDFEKDDDSNGHIEFLYAASNLRANNFRIENCDINKVKIIAGKIIPAIATTTAAIVGLVSLQLYTLKQTENINFMRDCNMNLSFNNYMFIKPVKCIFEKDRIDIDKTKYRFIPEKFTIWDLIEINESMTIKQFIEYMKEKFNVLINSINTNDLNLYDSKKNNNKFNNKIEEIYKEISKIKYFENKSFLIIDIYGKMDNFEIKMPKIKYNFKR